jgi:hypothetical protein
MDVSKRGSTFGGARAPGTPGQTKFDRTFSPKPKNSLKKACGKKKVHKESIYTESEMDPEDMMEEAPCTSCGECLMIDGEQYVDIAKMDDEKHWVFGWANISLQSDGNVPLDWQGDITAPSILEKAAYNFVLKFRGTGEDHKGGIAGFLIESVMFTREKMVAMGIPVGILPEGWWVGFYIPDPIICEKIKSGQYKMFSIQGRAKRLKV